MISAFVMPQLMMGAVPPSLLKSYQRSSSDVLVVRVGRVSQYRMRHNRLYVKARVKVLAAERSSRRLRRGHWITIRYRTYTRLPKGVFGGAPIPVLRKGHVYRAYLKQLRHSRTYAPHAGSKSFKFLY